MIDFKTKIAIPALCTALSAGAFTLDWDRIEFWTGEGECRSALVVQFQDEGPKEAYVWGFRWNPEDYEGGAPTGEEMFRAIASGSDDLLLLTQYTGWMGSTVDGIGFQFPGCPKTLHEIKYDFEGASEDPRVSFDYYAVNGLMGQTKAPGDMTPQYCREALEAAEATNIIEHPINAREYGYPAYDYDWWRPVQPLNNSRQRWNAGWYDGYWSYWVGGVESDELSYSGLGYSSRKLSDGQVDGWKYALLDGPVWFAAEGRSAQNRVKARIDGNTGASEVWYDLNYSHAAPASGVTAAEAEESGPYEILSLRGVRIGECRAAGLKAIIAELPAGIYLLRGNGATRKIIKR